MKLHTYSRIRVKSSADEVTQIYLVVSPFPSVDRVDTETWDMFSVSSMNHQGLRRI
ncbi:NADH dehydrogenase [ubiquinone] iron-sulfur protein 3 [Phtheirospermum japonicum]|uniref:NADH dehydrogenase [ubiquinone] iron-sulfur protein 3 n=1 Tax=Phtheirospermum japonicum TaxID=374723 RepID=A0A830CK11_9LAMI|nr:NADH dehydrogenase [ubiquinone] iron-sulfur protein 3 [Phtheirospermum japonicum]